MLFAGLNCLPGRTRGRRPKAGTKCADSRLPASEVRAGSVAVEHRIVCRGFAPVRGLAIRMWAPTLLFVFRNVPKTTRVLLVLAAAVGIASCASTPEEKVAATVRPGELIFSGLENGACGAPQEVAITSPSGGAVSWWVTSSEPWLRVSIANGITPVAVTTSVDCTGLGPGVHEAALTFEVHGGEPVSVAARLIVNPSVRVTPATWKDGARGAFSVSTDDSYDSGFAQLLDSGLVGTFVMNGTEPPPYYPAMAERGMELGSHLTSHYCEVVDESTLRREIETNLDGVATLTGSVDNVISLVWPCGLTGLAYQAVAAEYFLSARGYNMNALEEPTPANLMNLKSFNSHEHEPFPPADLKTIVDAAEAEGKWANLVLHEHTNDDGAIAYSRTRDVWVAPIGTIVKYILQRDRTIIDGYGEDGSSIRFSVSRLPIAPSVRRVFESSITPDDTVTFRVDLSGRISVESVIVGGDNIPFSVKEEGGRRYLFFSSPVSGQPRAVDIRLTGRGATAVQRSGTK